LEAGGADGAGMVSTNWTEYASTTGASKVCSASPGFKRRGTSSACAATGLDMGFTTAVVKMMPVFALVVPAFLPTVLAGLVEVVRGGRAPAPALCMPLSAGAPFLANFALMQTPSTNRRTEATGMPTVMP
jgi:hypothetical protein